jgi:hypothetical protein
MSSSPKTLLASSGAVALSVACPPSPWPQVRMVGATRHYTSQWLTWYNVQPIAALHPATGVQDN